MTEIQMSKQETVLNFDIRYLDLSTPLDMASKKSKWSTEQPYTGIDKAIL